MRGVNETIARMANDEENLKGRFWEGRYKSQALLDEAALLTCMAYVDLNPIRANMTDDLIKSDFTSIQQRLFDYAKRKHDPSKDEKILVTRVKKQKQLKSDLELDDQPEAKLMKFKKSMKNEEPLSLLSLSHTSLRSRGEGMLRSFDKLRMSGAQHERKSISFRNAIHDVLPMTQQDYFSLVGTTGRCIRDDKPGYIKHDIPPILKRLNIDADQWLEQVKHFHQHYAHCAGSPDNITQFAKRFKRSWGKGMQVAKRMYKEVA
jgi:hypothetical protein